MQVGVPCAANGRAIHGERVATVEAQAVGPVPVGRDGVDLLNQFSGVILTAALALAILVSVLPRVLADHTYIVADNSMAPTMPAGSLLLAQAVPVGELHVGDVIAYRRPEQPTRVITHRIVDLRIPDPRQGTAPIIRTRGDANPADDPWETHLQGIAWRRTISIPLVGYLVAFAAVPGGAALLLFLPSAGLTALWAARAFRRLKLDTARTS